jgi:DNA-binding NarL/FixJ family response regulator
MADVGWQQRRTSRPDGEILLAVPDDPHSDLVPNASGTSRLRLAGSLETAIITLRDRATVSLCLLDERLIGPAAAQMLHKVVAIAGDAPVIVLYENGSSATVSSYLMAGAAGVLPRRSLRSLLQWLAPIAADGSGTPDLRIDSLPLSRREREVAAMIALGRSNKEIARALDLQEVTVKVYASALFRKLNVRNRTEAAARLLSMGVGAS